MTIYIYLPLYLKKRNALLTFFLVVITLFTATLGERICLRLLNSLPVVFDELFSVVFIYLFLETNFMVGSAIAIKLLKIWIEQQNEKHNIEKENLQSELNVLKAQLHPHFLFNTMNNLYALSLEESSKTSEGIAKISDLLRSVLYECNDAEYELEKEIKLIDNFIELEMMRHSALLKISFNKNGDFNNIKIAPMLLFTLVENCFKHGKMNNPDDSWVKLDLLSKGNSIIFEAINSKQNGLKKEKDNHEGIGLSNLKKRLDLLYPGRYKFTISDEKDSFKVHLEIKCKK